MKKVVTIVQARTGSSRFPGKVLKDLGGVPLLLRMIERVRAANFAGTIIVATTTEQDDDYIIELCKNENINYFRGDTNDLLDRHYKAALQFDAQVVVKIPSDCPLIDPQIIDKVLYRYLIANDRYDYISNLHPATYPDGNDVEVMSMSALETAWHEADKDFEREHTTPFLWENPGRFRLSNVFWETGQDMSMTHRWTIDYPEDYEFIKSVFNQLYSHNPVFSLEDILTLLAEQPEIMKINEQFAGVNWYRHHLSQLKSINESQTNMINL